MRPSNKNENIGESSRSTEFIPDFVSTEIPLPVGAKSPSRAPNAAGRKPWISELLSNDGQPATYPLLAVRARNGRVAEQSGRKVQP
jgi:hypothetical protein